MEGIDQGGEMTRLRGYTERVNIEGIRRILSAHFAGYTIYDALGVWERIEENSLIMEVLTDNAEEVTKFLKAMEEIKTSNKQQAVLVTQEEVTGSLI
jgi:hypothetical protein